MVADTNELFHHLDNKRGYRDGIKALERRWIKCIELDENYVEK